VITNPTHTEIKYEKKDVQNMLKKGHAETRHIFKESRHKPIVPRHSKQMDKRPGVYINNSIN
jgi:hypothetical protein